MKTKRVLMVPAATLMFLLPWGAAQAFECPQHFAAAQAAIDKVTEDMGGGMSMQMDRNDMALLRALLDDAKSLLASAMLDHEKPHGMAEHGRAIAKADAARGYAVGTDIFHFKLMGMPAPPVRPSGDVPDLHEHHDHDPGGEIGRLEAGALDALAALPSLTVSNSS